MFLAVIACDIAVHCKKAHHQEHGSLPLFISIYERDERPASIHLSTYLFICLSIYRSIQVPFDFAELNGVKSDATDKAEKRICTDGKKSQIQVFRKFSCGLYIGLAGF